MNKNNFHHISVLLKEAVEGLRVRDGYTYVDCTTGSGSHSFQIAQRMGQNGRLICIDRDKNALEAAKKRLVVFEDKITFVHENFTELGNILDSLKVDNLGGVLMDLGCSSPQFDTPERGFSYMHDAPLDMRMNEEDTLSAYDVVNEYSESKLKEIIYEYGEERFASRIASFIVNAREKSPIQTTGELSDIIKSAIFASARADGPHPAKRTFQAIRIEVNKELDAIAPAMKAAANRLISGGRLSIISFHSLEDRIVKNTISDLSSGCTCPKDFPICVCNKKPTLKQVNKKPILPSAEELENNPRSRSAKLRLAEKL